MAHSSARLLVLMAALALAGCGGGSDDRPATAPPPPPAAPPAPPPPPPPGSDFDTAEFDRSTGLDNINALPAFEAGGSGEGITVGIVDTGIDLLQPDLVGKISSASADVDLTRRGPSAQDEDSHGTEVAGIIGASRSDFGVLGVAFGATLLAARADLPDPCEEDGEEFVCFSDGNIARGIRLALANGARVINISLGGEAFGFQVRDAIRAAAAADALVIISAGNDGEVDPSGFAQIALDPLVRGHVLVVGATTQTDLIADFSNRAGNLAEVFLVAPGQGINSTTLSSSCAPPSGPGACIVFGIAGTSFAAPHVAGAAAVLAQLFPNLSGAEIAEILLLSAKDLGAAGVDSIFGNGLLDLGAAIRPIGTTSVPTSADGSSSAPVDGGTATSAAFGDALARSAAFGGILMVDRFRRGFRVDLGDSVVTAPRDLGLLALVEHNRRVAGGELPIGDTVRFSLSAYDRDEAALNANLDNRTQALARRPRPVAHLSGRIDERTSAIFAYGFSAGRLLASAGGGDPVSRFALASRIDTPLLGSGGEALTLQVGHALASDMKVDLAVSQRRETPTQFEDSTIATPRSTNLATFGLAKSFGRLVLAGHWGVEFEDGALLGTRSSGAFALGEGARTLFGLVDARFAVASGWSAFARYQRGSSASRGPAAGLVSDPGKLATTSFAVGIAGNDVLRSGDRFGLAILQPMRVSGGSATVRVPVDRDFDLDRFIFEDRRLDFSPSGREIDIELSWGMPLAGRFRFEANLVQQFEPGHIADAAPVTSLLLRLRTGF